MPTPILEFRGVSKSFPQAERGDQEVLRDLAFSIQPAQTIAMVGRSGSGKSTLLHLAAGIELPSSGTILLNGQDVSTLSERQRTLLRRDQIGLVFQFFHLLPKLTVYDNVILPEWIAGGASDASKQRLHELLERVGLAHRAHDPVQKLSGGEMQRIAICRALLRRPRLLLADEPTGNLDDDTGRIVMDLLLQLSRAEGSALLYVTHSRELARRGRKDLDTAQRDPGAGRHDSGANRACEPRPEATESVRMIAYFLRALRMHFSSGRTLFLLTLGGVALGVASVVCIQVLNRNSLSAFSGGMRAVSGDADFSVVGVTPTVDESILPRILADRDVAAAWPLLRIDVLIDGTEDDFLEVIGFDVFAPASRPHHSNSKTRTPLRSSRTRPASTSRATRRPSSRTTASPNATKRPRMPPAPSLRPPHPEAAVLRTPCLPPQVGSPSHRSCPRNTTGPSATPSWWRAEARATRCRSARSSTFRSTPRLPRAT